jgi:hypothetical protein
MVLKQRADNEVREIVAGARYAMYCETKWMSKKWTTVAGCTLALALLWMSIAGAQSASIEGHWEGEAVREGARLSVSFDFRSDDSGTSGTFTASSQRVMDYSLDSVRVNGQAVQFSLGGGSLKFAGQFTADRMSGTVRDGEAEGEFRLQRTQPVPLPYNRTDVTFHNSGVVLAGSLFTPLGGGPHPAVVFVHGSGAETRWGTSRFYADQFARAGIAALIFDKRGTG